MPILELFVLPGSSILATVTKNFFLHRFHFPRGRLCSIVKPVQMQKPMGDVKAKLAGERVPKCAGMPLRCLDADKDFAVLKREHVGRTRLMHKFPM